MIALRKSESFLSWSAKTLLKPNLIVMLGYGGLSRAGTSNTRPARGLNAAPNNLLRSRKYRSLEGKWLFFQFFLWNYVVFRFLFDIPTVSIQNLKKNVANWITLWPLNQFYCIMRPSDSWTSLMRPASRFEFETPDLETRVA